MDKKQVQKALDYVRSRSKERKFDQSIDLTMNFKGIDFKKQDNQVEADIKFPHSTGKQAEVKTLVFVKDKLFAKELKGKVDRVVLDSEIPNIKKKQVDEILKEYNVLLAEGPALIEVGKYLGQQLAPKGRMPQLIQKSVSNVVVVIDLSPFYNTSIFGSCTNSPKRNTRR